MDCDRSIHSNILVAAVVRGLLDFAALAFTPHRAATNKVQLRNSGKSPLSKLAFASRHCTPRQRMLWSLIMLSTTHQSITMSTKSERMTSSAAHRHQVQSSHKINRSRALVRQAARNVFVRAFNLDKNACVATPTPHAALCAVEHARLMILHATPPRAADIANPRTRQKSTVKVGTCESPLITLAPGACGAAAQRCAPPPAAHCVRARLRRAI